MKKWVHNVEADREVYVLSFDEEEYVAIIEVMSTEFLFSCHVGCTTYSRHRLKAATPDEAKKEAETILAELQEYNLNAAKEKMEFFKKGLSELSNNLNVAKEKMASFEKGLGELSS